MEYLDRWNGQIRNFDNTDDYREEVQRVKNIQGQQFKFDFTDYIIKILLATFVKWYFDLDQRNVGSNNAKFVKRNFDLDQRNVRSNNGNISVKRYLDFDQRNVESNNGNTSVKRYIDFDFDQRGVESNNGNRSSQNKCCVII
jgi:hypothetical protein